MPKEKIVNLLDNAEEVVYLLLSLILVLLSLFILFYSPYEAIEKIHQGTPPIHASVLVVKDLLLIMIIMEILWLIMDYIKTKKINVEPFLIIGIISGIRKVLIIGAHPLEAPDLSPQQFSLVSKEIVLYTGVVFVLVVSLLLIRISKRKH